jgi:hypothetical protein
MLARATYEQRFAFFDPTLSAPELDDHRPIAQPNESGRDLETGSDRLTSNLLRRGYTCHYMHLLVILTRMLLHFAGRASSLGCTLERVTVVASGATVSVGRSPRLAEDLVALSVPLKLHNADL